MKAYEQAPKDWAQRGLAAVTTVVALQPGVTGLAALLLVAGAFWIIVRKLSSILDTVWFLACLVFGAAAIEAGVSPALAMAACVLALGVAPSLPKRVEPWVAPWIAALALTQMPCVLQALLKASDNGPDWAGILAVPCLFLIAGTVGGALRVVWAAAAALSVLALCYTAYQLEWNPPLQATLAALPPAALLLAPRQTAPGSVRASAILLAVGFGASMWSLVPAIGRPAALSVWIPEAKTAVSHYYEQYSAVLEASGFVAVRTVTEVNDVSPGDWVLLPSAAHPTLQTQLQQLKQLPHYASLRIVVAGEHTDASGVASAMGASGSPVALHVDTTIPPGNANLLGWSSGPGVVLPRTLALNRGASIDARAWNTVPLVWIQGGHREADRSDDGRLGDMVLRRGERAGLYSVVALGREWGGPVWIVLGDSTPLLNEYLAADPEAFARLLAGATGVPALLGLIAWMALYWAVLATGPWGRGRIAFGVALTTLAITALSGPVIASGFRDASQSNIEIVDRDSYGDRAVGRAVVALSRAVLDADVRLEIGRVSASAQNHQIISIGHPPGWASRVDCVRAGNVSIELIRVLDVVTCPEASEGSVLSIGNDAIVYRRSKQLIVLDQHFLANAAPLANQDWLRARIGELNR